MKRVININDYRNLARRRLPPIVFDYLEGGAEDESSLQHNREVLERIRLRSRRLVDVSQRNLHTMLFGSRLAAPLLLSPTGLNGLLWPKGDIILARVAAKHGIPLVVSTASTSTLEDIARSCRAELWFQLYVVHRQLAATLLRRALAAGYTTLVLTADVPVNGYRERDLRNDFRADLRYTPKILWQGLTHPSWTWGRIRHGAPALANLAQGSDASPEVQAALLSRRMDATFDWSALSWLRDLWPHRLLVKGITHPDDAVRCEACGVDGVILSNHGGRQFDACVSPVEILSATARLTKLPIIIDSGFRRGSEIAKVLAMGAQAVGLGRAVLYGLAANGEAGASHAVELIKNELDLALAHLGCASVDHLSSADLLMTSEPGKESSRRPSLTATRT